MKRRMARFARHSLFHQAAVAFLLVGCFGGPTSEETPESEALATDAQADVPAPDDSILEPQPDGSGELNATSIAPSPAPARHVELLESCRACATGSLDGVELCIWADDCNFEVGEGGTFYYSVRVERTAAITTTVAQSRCAIPSTDPLGFVDYWVTDDEGVHYCACDLGLCPPQEGESLTLQTGDFEGSFTWSGREWNGPSDVAGGELGPFFGPGEYVARIDFGASFALTEGTARVDLPIQVLPLNVGITDACAELEGPKRDCGWDITQSAFECEPGETVTLGCGAGCGFGANTCSGAPMIRVCADENQLCAAADALALDSGTCSFACPAAEFVCPASGMVTILTGATLAGDPYECTVATPLDPAAVGPAPAPMAKTRTQFAAALGLDGRIYVSGGSGFLADCEAYEPTANAWSAIAPLTQPRGGHGSAAGADGRIYVFGGRADETEASILAHVEAYDPASDSWSPVTPMPTARLAPAAVTANDGKIYVIGGTFYGPDSPFLADLDVVEVYDPSTDSWALAAPLPYPSMWLQAVLANDGRIYAFSVGPERRVGIYDPATNVWSLGAPHQVTRWGAGAALAADGSIIVAGGPPREYRTIAESYDPATDTWQSLAPMAYQREYPELISDLGGRVYAIGGDSTGQVERYLADERVWY